MDGKDWDRIAAHYFEEISSPFEEGVDNPLYDALVELSGKKKMHVADFGCGIGNLTPYLGRHFGMVTAIDFSEEMVKRTGERCKDQKNVVVIKSDLRDLSLFKSQFHVAVAVNSIILPSIVDVKNIFSQICASLKPGGHFFGIFPSMNSELYKAMLTFDHEYEKSHDEEKAMKSTRRIIGERSFDLLFGLFENEGKQKHFYSHELEHRLHEAGFKKIHLKKVLYPWTSCENDELAHEKEAKLYDWFVSAEKP